MPVPSLFGDSDSHEARTASPDEPEVPAATGDASLAHASLYRKYRPQSFDSDELVGQEHIIRTLQNAVRLGRVAHAYLFSGPRGTGKTTTARVLAKAINCLHHDASLRPCNECRNCRAINAGSSPDVVEIDAASNRGIDDIRDLRERVRYAPTQLQSKVYIIDEAHQITGAAANAFLKTLEEPPPHAFFILATTDPEELLPTIVSRCQRFDFRRVSVDNMMRRLRAVAAQEGITIDEDALRVIARNATGSLRDALGLLDQLALGLAAPGAESDSSSISAADVNASLGLSGNDRVEALVTALARRDAGEALGVVQDAVDSGEDPRQLNRQLLSYLRLLLSARSGVTGEADSRARELSERFTLAELAALARRFGEIDFSIKHAPFPQLPLEVALVEAAAISAPDPETKSRAPQAPGEQIPDRPPSAPQVVPTSLRDRVRSSSTIRSAPAAEQPRVDSPEPATITPLRSAAVVEAGVDAAPVEGRPLDVDYVAQLWPNVRADVKALNRRVEALLSEVDPVAISGNQITLAVPYPFHRDKLNSEDVRETVGGVLSRLLGREISLVCILRSEMASPPSQGRATQSQEVSPAQADDDPDPDEEERVQARIRAAMNIFDAEEIPEPEAAAARASSRDA